MFDRLQDFETAADKYADVSEKTSAANGEDSPKNADILYLYGRTLYKIAMQKSQVLGSRSVEQTQPVLDPFVKKENPVADDPRFSFAGDEIEEGSEGEEEQKVQPEDSTEDDFQNAWEVLDLARLSYQKQLDSQEEFLDKDQVKKNLAETYDLLGEVSLENG